MYKVTELVVTMMKLFVVLVLRNTHL